MAAEFAFVVIFAIVASSVSECPLECICRRLQDNTLGLNCPKMTAEFLEDWPAETSKLNLSNNGQKTIKWPALASLRKLKELDLSGNRVNCNCNYYKYWKNNIHPSSGVNVTGECAEPSSRKGMLLSQAGAHMKQECDRTKMSEKVTPLTTTTAQLQPKSSSTKQIKPTATLSSTTSTSKTTLLKTSVPSNKPSSSAVIRQTVSPGAVKTTMPSSVMTSQEQKTTTSYKESTPTTQPTTRKPPHTTTQPPTTSKLTDKALVKETTAQPSSKELTTTESPTTEESTTQQPTTPPKPGPPRMNLYLGSKVVKIGSVVEVICQVSGLPKPEVNMTVNGQDAKTVNSKFHSQKNGAKVIFEAKLTSEVTCHARNKFGMKKDMLRVVIERNTISYFSLEVKLYKKEYTNDYKDKTSTKFRNLESQLSKELTSDVFNEFAGFYGSTLLSARPGSIIADILIKTSNSSLSQAKKLIEKDIQKATLGEISVDRYSYSFTDKTDVCPGEYLNVTWPDMLVGQTAVALCPRGAKGIAKRNCTENGWYYPDYTQCKSDQFAQLKKQMLSATSGFSSSPSVDILEILNGIKNLSVAYLDFSHLAGDLNLCIEIIEMLTNYTKHHRNDVGFNDNEAQLVVDVTSNIINRNHEQELIISQKLVQKASTLIRVVELYGLQAATAVSNGTKDLKFFIAENLVMGVGVVEPLTISNDVTFPNYEIPAIDAVRKGWGSSSFIVIDKEIIEDLIKVKRFRIAGFLYRTLTRILSAESAYSMVGQGYEINSAVVSITLDPPLPPKLKTPIIIASNNLDEVRLDGDSPICAFWDFNLNKPNGGWSDKGCWYTHYNTHNTTCLCDHLTNFAVLKEKPVFIPQPQKAVVVSPPFFLCILIGCIIMICFCAITLFLLLLFAWRMKPDRTWGMHMFVCATLITAFALIIVGLYKYNEVFLCRLMSILVHYFYLCGITWIMAEATYMSVWTTTEGPKKRYWIGYFFLGFVPAGVPLAIAWLVDGMSGFESISSCWMSLANRLLWVFFIPAVFFLVVTILIFRKVWKTATGNLRVPLKATYWRTRFRVHVRYSVAIQILLILTWLFGLLVITYHATPLFELVFCILFIIFCVITGFVIIIFYCIMDRQFDDAFRDCCCYCCNQGKYEVQKREDLWAQQHPELAAQPERQSPLEQEQEHDPLIVYVTRKPPASEPSMSSIDDPLYERVKKPGEEEPPVVEPEEKEPEVEPLYAKVYKDQPKDESDPFPIAQPGSPRFQRGLTRLEVMRMAKKSDASKRELKKFESPKGSQDDLVEHPTYLLNQQELDEELQHFRTFFADSKPSSRRPSTSNTPPGTPTPSPLPRTLSAVSSSSSTTKTTSVVKKTTSSTTRDSSDTRTHTQTHESFQSSSTFTHESTTRVTRSISPDRDSPPALPPRAPDLLDDDDDYSLKECEAQMDRLDVERDDESFTDVSADLDRDSDEESTTFIDGTKPTAV